MEIMLKIGIPFSVLLVIVGSLIYLEGHYWKVFTSRIIVALISFILFVLDIYLLAQGPIEIQAKKYIVVMSIALTIYIIGLRLESNATLLARSANDVKLDLYETL